MAVTNIRKFLQEAPSPPPDTRRAQSWASTMAYIRKLEANGAVPTDSRGCVIFPQRDPQLGYLLPVEPRKPNPRKKREGYAERFAARQRQACPARPSVPARKGPSKRPRGLSQHRWVEMLTGKSR